MEAMKIFFPQIGSYGLQSTIFFLNGVEEHVDGANGIDMRVHGGDGI